jgi:UDP-N-acetylglucosamine 3-dehydrogenase
MGTIVSDVASAKVRVGVIGVGAMGQHHARVYSELPDVELVGVTDVNADLGHSIAERFYTKAFSDYKKLLKQDLDAVSIAVPTSLHKKVAVDVADAGVNMLLEKPIADTVANAQEIIRKAEHNRVKLMIGHIERFNPIIPVIKRSVENSDIISIDITRVGPMPPRIRDVGVVIDLATHDIDLIRYLANSEFKKIHGLASRTLSKREDIAILSFELENGILAHITTNWLTPYKVREINIYAKRKLIRGELINQRVLEFSNYGKDGSYLVKELSVPFAEPLKLELEAFIKSISKGNEPPVTGYDGLKAIEVALKCLSGVCGNG